MTKHFFVTTLLLGSGVLGAGCETSGEAPVPDIVGNESHPDVNVTRVTAETLAQIPGESRLAVALRSPKDALVMDPSLGRLDFERIDITCPNGQQMPMDAWLQNTSQQWGVDSDHFTGDEFSLGTNQTSAILGLDEQQAAGSYTPQGTAKKCCEEDCYTCPDGVTTCTCLMWWPANNPCP